MLHPNGDGTGNTFQGLNNTTPGPDEEPREKDPLLTGQVKSQFIQSLRSGKRQNKHALQQVISARQQKIYEQQCEIEELRRRIREVCNDNKFLREQNYWQAKALDKLDGKHAELPQLINGHLEEIRVFREQIKRMKEVLKLEKQRRHDAEGTKEKALHELKHLRKLADEHKLLEREDLRQTIEKLQTEAQEREKLLVNLERYAENLEKNQRFESLRATKARREMRDTCQQLLDKIQELEQTVQEKQKIIELGNIYSKRGARCQSFGGQLESHVTAESASNRLDTVTTGNDVEQTKGSIRERIKMFDQKRQDMERKREQLRRKRQQHNDLSDETADSPTNTAGSELKHFSNNATASELSETPLARPFSARLESNKSDCTTALFPSHPRPRSSYNLVVLPKIRANTTQHVSEYGFGKRTRSSTDNKQVRFCTFQVNEHLKHGDGNTVFENLRRGERISRMLAEVHLERDTEMQSTLAAAQITDPTDTEFMSHLRTVDRPTKRPELVSTTTNCFSHQHSTDFITSVKEDESPSPIAECQAIASNRMNSNTISEVDETVNQYESMDRSTQETTNSMRGDAPVHLVQPTEVSSTMLTAQIALHSPRATQTTQEEAPCDSLDLVPMADPTMQICRPCGDHDTDGSLIGETSGDSPCSSDAIVMGPEEDSVWQDTSSVYTGCSGTESLRNMSRVFRGPTGLVANAANENDGLEMEYIAEAPFGYLQERQADSDPAMRSKKSIPSISCSARTTTLYTMINNSAENETPEVSKVSPVKK